MRLILATRLNRARATFKQTKIKGLGTEVINTAREYKERNYEKLLGRGLGFVLGLGLALGLG